MKHLLATTLLCFATSSYATTSSPFNGGINLYSSEGPGVRVVMRCVEDGDKATCRLVFSNVRSLSDSTKTPAEHRAEIAAGIDKTYQDAVSDMKKTCGEMGSRTHEMELAMTHIPLIAKRLDKIKSACDKNDYAKAASTFKQFYPSAKEFLADTVEIELQSEKVRHETCSVETFTRTVIMNRVSQHQWLWEVWREKPTKNSLGWRRLLIHNPETDVWTYRDMTIRSNDAPATFIGTYLKYASAKQDDTLHEIGCKYITR